MSIEITINRFRQFFKVRYIILAALFIVTPFVVPFYYPIDADYAPEFSTKSTGTYGHSMMFEHLSESYNIERYSLDFSSIPVSKDNLLIIQSPQREFDANEFEHLRRIVHNDMKVLVIGSRATTTIQSLFSFSAFATDSDRILDFTNNLNGNPSLVEIKFEGQEYYSITPFQLWEIDYGYGVPQKEYIQTQPTAEEAYCVEFIGDNCKQQFNIGAVQDNIAFISDDFIFSNYLINETNSLTSSNLDLLDALLNQLGNIDTIIFDEIHYKWLPLNEMGIQHFTFELLSPLFIFIVISLITTILPGLAIISSKNRTRKQKDAMYNRSMRQRLNTLSVEGITAVPLSIEETTLVKEHLEYKTRRRYYFSYVAHDLIEYIHANDLRKEIPHDLYGLLEAVKYTIPTNSSAWSIIKAINQRLDQILFKEGEDKE